MAPIAKQDIRFCKTVDGVTISYNDGARAATCHSAAVCNSLEADLVEGPFAEVYEALAQHCMVIRF